MNFLSLLLKFIPRHSLLLATTVIIMAAALLGCSKKPEPVGKWQNTNVEELLEFKDDSSGMIKGKNLPPLMFAWRKEAEHSYILDVNFQGQKKSLRALVQNDSLVLEGEGGKETYRKTQ